MNMDLHPFIHGGVASIIAEICTFPIDTTKTRLQIQGELHNNTVRQFKGGQYSGMFHAFKVILKNEGVTALYRGLNAALIRQASYGTMKIGLYDTFKRILHKNNYRGESVTGNVCCAVLAGVASSAIANPTDVIKVRLQTKSNYNAHDSTFFNELSATVSKEGVRGLYKAVIPTATRSALLVGVLLPTYDFSKRTLVRRQILLDDISCHFASSLIAATFGSFASCPIEVIRTRLMNQTCSSAVIDQNLISKAAKYKYESALDCFKQTVKNESVLALWKGFIPTWYRIGPWNIIFFLTYEQMSKLRFVI